MLAKKFPIKPKVINFSSEDSQDTDASLNSSIDAVDENAQNTVGSKFNKLRETMNKYFMANPELAEEIRFEQYTAPDDDDQQPNMGGNSPDRVDSPDNKRSKRGDESLSIENRSSSQGKVLSRQQTGLKIPQEESQVTHLSGSSNKLWSAFSREMNRGQKNTKAPSLPQITHMLNLFKQNFEKPSVLDNTMTSPKGITGSPRKTYTLQAEKPDFRIQSAKSAVKDDGKGKRGKDGKKKGEDQNQEDNEEDGVTYFSIRKKKHLQMKHQIRAQEELNREQRKKDREERDRLSKEREHKNVMNTLAELDEEVRKGPNYSNNAPKSQTMLEKGDTTGKNKKRRNSTKQSTNIFDRLTKDTSNRNDFDENAQRTFDKNGKAFLSPFAESLYNEMKAFGNNEGFKRIANYKINAFKREFKEKMAAQRKLPTDGLKFTKDNTKYYNTFLPDFDRTANVQNKDSVFIHNEVIRGSEEWRENPENELLAKFQKMTNGTLFEYWRDAKELNQ